MNVCFGMYIVFVLNALFYCIQNDKFLYITHNTSSHWRECVTIGKMKPNYLMLSYINDFYYVYRMFIRKLPQKQIYSIGLRLQNVLIVVLRIRHFQLSFWKKNFGTI